MDVEPNGVLYFPKGGLVKIALGGALFSMGQHVTSPDDALHFAEQMQAGLRIILNCDDLFLSKKTNNCLWNVMNHH